MISDEARRGFVEAARLGRARAKEARDKSPLRRNFADDPTWVEMAKKHKVRLPLWGTPCSTKRMEQWLRRIGKGVAWYREVTGFGTLQEWIDHNMDWPMRAFAGIMLEAAEAEGE